MSFIAGSQGTMIRSFSQIQQDVRCLRRFEFKSGGTFLDIGAFDGKTISNTYLLEECFKWKGICIEANPVIFEKLKENRQKTTNINCVIGSAPEKRRFFFNETHPELSGVEWSRERHENEKGKCKLIDIVPLYSILTKPSHFDFLSLDVEGHELEVLKGIDWENTSFGFMTVEHNYDEGYRKDIRQFLSEKNYMCVAENKWDDEFVPRKLFYTQDINASDGVKDHTGYFYAHPCFVAKQKTFAPKMNEM